MIKPFKIAPYSMTRGNDQYKKYIDQDFSHQMLQTINDGIFDDWKYKDLGGWVKYVNSDGINLEFYPAHYIVKLKNNDYKLPLPVTINEFIIDMNRLNIDLFYTFSIYDIFEPRDILQPSDIKEYYVILLERMNKSFELNI